MGASRRQVHGSVLAEAGIVGVGASVVGVGLGVLVAIALRGLLATFGIDIGDPELVFTGRTAAVGSVVGTLFGWMSVQALADQGVTTFAFPGGRIALAVVAAAIAGTLAAVLPARRAARVDVLRALAAE